MKPFTALATVALALLCSGWWSCAWAADKELGPTADAAIEAEAAQLARQRNEVLTRHEQALRDCERRFAVVDCQDRARQERDAALAPLRVRELHLAQLQRQARAEAQRQRLAAKQLAFAQQDAQQQSRALQTATPPVAIPAPRASAALAAPNEASPQPQRKGRPDERTAQQQAASRAQATQERQRQAEQHRREVQARNAARASQHPAAAPLPLPTGRELAASAPPLSR